MDSNATLLLEKIKLFPIMEIQPLEPTNRVLECQDGSIEWVEIFSVVSMGNFKVVYMTTPEDKIQAEKEDTWENIPWMKRAESISLIHLEYGDEIIIS